MAKFHFKSTYSTHMRALVMLLACTILLSSCSPSSGVPLAPVTGNVTFYGRPARAEIAFQPVADQQKTAGRPSIAFSDQHGNYVLGYSAQELGAIIGKHRVLIKILPYSDEAEVQNYNNSAEPLKIARLMRVVHPGPNRFDFSMTY